MSLVEAGGVWGVEEFSLLQLSRPSQPWRGWPGKALERSGLALEGRQEVKEGLGVVKEGLEAIREGLAEVLLLSRLCDGFY